MKHWQIQSQILPSSSPPFHLAGEGTAIRRLRNAKLSGGCIDVITERDSLSDYQLGHKAISCTALTSWPNKLLTAESCVWSILKAWNVSYNYFQADATLVTSWFRPKVDFKFVWFH